MSSSDALEVAIERAYAAFAHVPCPTKLHASPLRNAKAILRDLTVAPLRELGAEHIQGYASYAMTTVGTRDDYRHFLPRLLELAVHDASAFGTEPQVIAGKLVYGEWTTWAPAERGAVAGLFGAAMDAAIEWPLHHRHNAEDWLCGLARLDIAPDPWLARWRTAALPHAGVQLAELVTGIIDGKGEMFGAYWEEVAPAIKTVVTDWVFDRATHDRLLATRPLVAAEEEWHIDLALTALSWGERTTTRH